MDTANQDIDNLQDKKQRNPMCWSWYTGHAAIPILFTLNHNILTPETNRLPVSDGERSMLMTSPAWP